MEGEAAGGAPLTVRSDDPVEVAVGVGPGEQGGEDLLPSAVGGPGPKLVVDAFPRAETLGQVRPRDPCAVLERDRVDRLPVITPSSSGTEEVDEPVGPDLDGEDVGLDGEGVGRGGENPDHQDDGRAPPAAPIRRASAPNGTACRPSRSAATVDTTCTQGGDDRSAGDQGPPAARVHARKERRTAGSRAPWARTQCRRAPGTHPRRRRRGDRRPDRRPYPAGRGLEKGCDDLAVRAGSACCLIPAPIPIPIPIPVPVPFLSEEPRPPPLLLTAPTAPPRP